MTPSKCRRDLRNRAEGCPRGACRACRRAPGLAHHSRARRFERDPTGNAPDCSGYFPGEGKYKDPARPDVNFASMMAEKAVMAEIESNKKAGDVPGAPGCLNKSL